MPQRVNLNGLNRQIRQAQRKADDEWRREIDRVNRENQRRVNTHNRKVEEHNRKVITSYNRHVDHVNAHNAATISDMQRQLRRASNGPQYTVTEEALANRIQDAVARRDDREWDIFLSYARIDGAEVANTLRRRLEALNVTVWFDGIAITPGTSQALQMDRGLQKARAGIVLLTPAYLVGRFWTERELGALLHKEMLIPVLDGVTFDEVTKYSGILPDLAGFQTVRDSVDIIAQKIAAAVGRA